MKAIRTPETQQDLKRYAKVIALSSGVNSGIRFIERFEETVEQLTQFPFLGPTVSDSNPLLNTVRYFPIKKQPNHLVIYQPHATCGIRVLRIIHAAMDLESTLERSLSTLGNDLPSE